MILLTPEKAEKVMMALSRLQDNPDFRFIRDEWINASYEDAKVSNIDRRGESGIRGQGYAEALRDITGPFNNPGQTITKIKKIIKYNKEDVDTDMY